jgi:protein-disulfide isomerase
MPIMADRSTLSRKSLAWLLVPALVIAAAAAWFALDPGFRGSETSQEAQGPETQDEFGQRVRNYLLENPQVIVEAMQVLQARQQAAEASEIEAVLAARADEVFRDPMSPVTGNPDGDVSLVEFFDYNCPYCRRVAPVVAEAEAADPQLRIVYKEFPILGPGSVFAARAALAAHRQGLYFAFHEALMQAGGRAEENSVLTVAKEVGLDVERLKSDMKDPEIQAAIDRNLALAEALRITGTPGFVVGRQILRGATDLRTLQSLIREERVATQ